MRAINIIPDNKLSSMTKRSLPFRDLFNRHPGVTLGPSESYSEAASVCLDRHHISPVDFTIERGNSTLQTIAEWETPSERIRRSWANETDRTTNGAYGLALAAIEISDNLVAVGRAENGTGADYYLGPANGSLEDFEQCFRLEVSGVDHGGTNTLNTRLRQKKERALTGKSNLPAIAAVVGFLATQILIADVELK